MAENITRWDVLWIIIMLIEALAIGWMIGDHKHHEFSVRPVTYITMADGSSFVQRGGTISIDFKDISHMTTNCEVEEGDDGLV